MKAASPHAPAGRYLPGTCFPPSTPCPEPRNKCLPRGDAEPRGMLLGTPNSEHLALGKGKPGAGNAPGTTAAWRFSRRLIRCRERGCLCRGTPEPRPAGSQRESMSVGASGIKEKAPVQTRGWMSSARINAAGEGSALLGGFHRPGWGCISSPWKGLDLRHPRTVFACAHPHVHAATPARSRAHPPLRAPTPAHSPPCTLTPTLLPHPPTLPSTPQRAAQPPRPWVSQPDTRTSS